MSDLDDDDTPFKNNRNYNINSKIMFTAIISLSLVILLVLVLHIYARFVLRRRVRRRTAIRNLGLYVSRTDTPEQPKTGLDPTVIASLPIFVFGQIDSQDATECAVCLSMLEKEEMARVLPNCKHTFHAECVDKWLSSQTTCPICRTEAEPPQLVPEHREAPVGVAPTAPPLEGLNQPALAAMEGTSDGAVQSLSKVNGSGLNLSSFRRMLSRERSSRRIQYCAQEDGIQDLERQ